MESPLPADITRALERKRARDEVAQRPLIKHAIAEYQVELARKLERAVIGEVNVYDRPTRH